MGILEDLGATLAGAVESAKEGASDLISGALTGIESAVSSAQAGVYSVLNAVSGIPSLISSTGEWIISSIGSTLNGIRSWLESNILENFKAVGRMFADLYDSMKSLYAWVKEEFTSTLNQVAATLRAGWDAFSKAFTEALEDARKTVEEKISEFIASVKALTEDFGVMLLSVLDEFFKRLGEAFKVDPEEAAKAFIEMQKAFMKMRVQELVA